MNKLGNRLRCLRKSQGLLLRQIVAQLETDTVYISKLERGERRAKHERVILLGALLNANPDELLTFCWDDQVYELVKNEKIAK